MERTLLELSRTQLVPGELGQWEMGRHKCPLHLRCLPGGGPWTRALSNDRSPLTLSTPGVYHVGQQCPGTYVLSAHT